MEYLSVSHLSISHADSGSESGSHKSIRDKRPSGPSDGKPTRVRTVLNEKQLHTLRWVVYFYIRNILEIF